MDIFSYAITINWGICHTALYELYKCESTFCSIYQVRVSQSAKSKEGHMVDSWKWSIDKKHSIGTYFRENRKDCTGAVIQF